MREKLSKPVVLILQNESSDLYKELICQRCHGKGFRRAGLHEYSAYPSCPGCNGHGKVIALGGFVKKCFELVEGSHSKFWVVQISGLNYFATFGRIGTAGQTQVKSFTFERQCEMYAEKMIASKLAKGYVKVADDAYEGAPEAMVRPKSTKEPVRVPVDDKPQTRSINL